MVDYSVPTAVVDMDVVQRNLQRMKRRLEAARVAFRPHFKTHQSAAVAEVFAREGIKRITVSSITMAHYFAKYGWKDITIAFPFNIREIERVLTLSNDVVPGLLISDPLTASYPFPRDILKKAVFWIELDTGHKRSGFPVHDFGPLAEVIDTLSRKGAQLQGFLFHDGHTYLAPSLHAIDKIRQTTIQLLSDLRDFLDKRYFGRKFLFSGGDTPSCSLDLPFTGIDEMRPGNFVFYDLQQMALGVCHAHDIALSVLCPVVASYPDQGRAIIYGGSIHLSKDKLSVNGQTIHGVICSEEMIPELSLDHLLEFPLLTSLSQEHGVVTGNYEQIKSLKPGQLARVIPVHSCLVVSNMKYLVSIDGMIFETLGQHFGNF